MAVVVGANTDGILTPKLEAEIGTDLQIARRKVKGWRTVFISSLIEGLGAAEEDLWEQGGTLVYPTAAGVVSMVSTSAADTAGGTGANAVLLEGLDANYDEISEVVVMNGTSAVTSDLEYLRLFSTTAVAAGTGERNAGDITGTIGGNIQTKMAANDSTSFNSHYTVPAGHRLYLKSVNFFQGANKTVTTSFMQRPLGLPWITLSKLQIYRIAEEVTPVVLPIEAMTDIKVVAQNDGGGTSSFTVIINYYLEKLG